MRIALVLLFVAGCAADDLEGQTKAGHWTVTMDLVASWAESIGNELWDIGKRVTKLEDVQQGYKDMNATVTKTDGKGILETILTRMNKLIKEKVDAVIRIRKAATEAEKNKEDWNLKERDSKSYYSSKYSEVTIFSKKKKRLNKSVDYQVYPNLSYTDLVLTTDPNFFGIAVNLTHSAVHVPTNIFDRWEEVIVPIVWSQALDKIFVENYEKDPSLKFQYFADISGYLRHFPAFRWSMDPDKYDCRTRTWYVQAATCSKEVAILIDNSGTMYGMKNTIAQLTVDALLRTFSNNDYINVFKLYGDGHVTGLVPCFNNTLVPATPENIALFKASLYSMCPEMKVNYFNGFHKALTVLHDFLEKKTSQTEQRNQAIFFLTDLLLSGNELKTIYQEYKNIYSDQQIEVELFIYFIGEDNNDVGQVQWDTCLGRGSVVHVRTMDEAQEDTLKYLKVMARKQNKDVRNDPVSWTHLFLDIMKDKGTPKKNLMKVEDFKIKYDLIHHNLPLEIPRYSNENTTADGEFEVEDVIEEDDENEDEDENEEYGTLNNTMLMTAVSTPVYSDIDREMIGVAAIHVPVVEFEKLTLPHKIGVNGYAFVVTHNGYLLFHPDLRIVLFLNGGLKKNKLHNNEKNETLRENFNSVDLTEVEFYEDDNDTPRQTNPKILELRNSLVNQSIGVMREMPIKFHYDNQQRVASESRDYFYAPLSCSSFSLGLALPRGYGNYWIQTNQKIIQDESKEKDNCNDIFQGNWQIHPKWSYCDYRDERKFNFNTSEEKLLHFLNDWIFKNGTNFTWVEEHSGEFVSLDNYTVKNFDVCFENQTTIKPNESYFCDNELMELLYFDAKLTQSSFNEKYLDPLNDTELIDFIDRNKIFVRFVATQGGLTRWQDVWRRNASNPKQILYNNTSNFGKNNNRALDEVWYKSAVLLHRLKSPSFVFSLPDTDAQAKEKIVTASHAVFYNYEGNEAPGVVVGYQMAYDTLKHLLERKSVFPNDSTSVCATLRNQWDCYIIDSNGYVVVSTSQDEPRDLKKFFGLVEAGVMHQMVSQNIFRKVPMFDYQALKIREPTVTSAGFRSLFNPFIYISWAIEWIVSRAFWLFIETNVWDFVEALTTCSSTQHISNETICNTCKLTNKTCPLCCKAPKAFSDPCQTREVPAHRQILDQEEEPEPSPVDEQFYLYLYTNLSAHGYRSNSSKTVGECSSFRPFFAKPIPYTNLLLVVVDHSYQTCVPEIGVDRKEIKYENYSDIPPCNKQMIHSYFRNKLRGCSEEASQVQEQIKCGQQSVYISSKEIIISVLLINIAFILD